MRTPLRQLAPLFLVLVGCEGVITVPPDAVTGPELPGADQHVGWPAFGPTHSFQLRRLTTEQYVATVQTLLGVSAVGMPPIEAISPVHGFAVIGASTVGVSSGGVAQFENAARFLTDAAFAPTAPRQKLSPCTPSGPADVACLTAFVTAFGQRAFRRPLTADEISRYTALASQVAVEDADAWSGMQLAASAFLQSPNFLYLPEIGVPDSTNPLRARHTDYELAARLSYFLTNNTPDDALLAAAASGSLSTVEGIQAQANRLLGLPGAHDAVRTFFSSLLAIDGLPTMGRDANLFPRFTPTLGAAMREETLLGFEDLVFTRDGDYRRVFDQQATFVNPELAALYGLPAPTGSGFQRVTLPASSGRLGLLGQAAVLAPRDHGDGTAPTKRGLFVLTHLLCENLPVAPPANLPIPPAPTGVMTQRQRLEQHSTNPVCASCHDKTDPVGLSLEHFDAIGAYRADDRGMAIDESGKVDATTYKGLAGLGATLRDHPALGPCLIQSLYDAANGHVSDDFDRASFAALVDKFQAGGSRIRPQLAAIVTSDGFRYRSAP